MVPEDLTVSMGYPTPCVVGRGKKARGAVKDLWCKMFVLILSGSKMRRCREIWKVDDLSGNDNHDWARLWQAPSSCSLKKSGEDNNDRRPKFSFFSIKTKCKTNHSADLNDSRIKNRGNSRSILCSSIEGFVSCSNQTCNQNCVTPRPSWFSGF